MSVMKRKDMQPGQQFVIVSPQMDELLPGQSQTEYILTVQNALSERDSKGHEWTVGSCSKESLFEVIPSKRDHANPVGTMQPRFVPECAESKTVQASDERTGQEAALRVVRHFVANNNPERALAALELFKQLRGMGL